MRRSTLSHVASLSLFLPLLLAISAADSGAATYLVRPDGTGDFPNIQSAIDAAHNGDTIELADGVFRGEGNRDIDYRGLAITVRSRSGNPGDCVIMCEGTELDTHRGFFFLSGEGPESVLRDLTITGALVNGC